MHRRDKALKLLCFIVVGQHVNNIHELFNTQAINSSPKVYQKGIRIQEVITEETTISIQY